MAKQINTRIQLKHDSLTNWNQSSIVLKPGEVGVAYVDVATKDAKGNIIHFPTALLKVGENKENSTATFKDLPFVSALAADVYGWAKENGIYVEVTGEGEAIANVEWKATETHPNGALVITKTNVVTPSELETALADYYTKTEIDNLFAGYYTKSEIDDKIQTINGTNSGLAERVESLETTRTGHGDIVTHNVAEFATAAQGALAEAAASKTYVDGEFAKYTKTDELPTDLGDFTNNAGYAKTSDVNVELNKKADKTQVATDIAEAIAPLATTEALNGVKAIAEAARTESEVDGQIDAKISALNLATTYEPIGAETRAKAYADGLITDANLGQYTTEQEVKDIVDGVIAGAADSETYNSLTKLVDYIDAHGGEASEMAQAIETLEGDVKNLKEAPSASIKASDIEAWNGEIGAKALAATKTTTAEVKTQIEAYGYATTGYADGKASAAQSAAEAKAAELDTALHAVISKEIDDDVKAAIDAEVLRANAAYDEAGAAAAAQAAAIADAAGKYETQGTAQGIVDGLKLAETYEPIGAETRAIAAAKTETQNQISALNISQYETSAHAEATYRKAADKITSDDMSDEVWVFNCGTSTTVI